MTAPRTALLVASLGGVGFFAMSVLVLGVWPGRVLEDETRRMAPEHSLPLTPSEQRGRDIYAREGCAYCHTQQIRYLARDVDRFGKPTLAWETRFDYPQLWGTRRIGPDLSRESSIRSDDWQLSHLYNPRAVVPDSVMPAFPGLFAGAPDRPLQGARDLLAYLSTLGKARELAGPEGEAKAQDTQGMGDFRSAPLNASPATARRTGTVPQLASVAASPRGRELYSENCAGCHGARGEGDGPAAAGLSPRPTNLTVHEYTQARVAADLWNGVAGTAMPGWRDLPRDDLAALIATVRRFHAAAPEPNPPQQIVDLGRQVYKDNCAQCHGNGGAGDGPGGNEISIAPDNFVTGRPDVAESLQALRNGVAGTPMAQWTTRLNEAELSAVAYYVRSFYKPQ